MRDNPTIPTVASPERSSRRVPACGPGSPTGGRRAQKAQVASPSRAAHQQFKHRDNYLCAHMRNGCVRFRLSCAAQLLVLVFFAQVPMSDPSARMHWHQAGRPAGRQECLQDGRPAGRQEDR